MLQILPDGPQRWLLPLFSLWLAALSLSDLPWQLAPTSLEEPDLLLSSDNYTYYLGSASPPVSRSPAPPEGPHGPGRAGWIQEFYFVCLFSFYLPIFFLFAYFLVICLFFYLPGSKSCCRSPPTTCCPLSMSPSSLCATLRPGQMRELVLKTGIQKLSLFLLYRG